MTLVESINEKSMLERLKNKLTEYFEKYDRLIDKYTLYIPIYLKNSSKSTENTVRDTLNEIVKTLNELQIIFERLGYSNTSSTLNDVSETIFVKQLSQFQKQAYYFMNDFSREYFQSFYENLCYITLLAELHYNNMFGSLDESIEVSEDTSEMLEDAKEYLEDLPEIKTNEVK